MRIFVILSAFLLFFGHFQTVRAEDTPELPVVFKGRYAFSWSGIPIGSLSTTIQQDGTHYAAKASSKSTGMVRWFVKHKATSKARGKLLQGRHAPRHYHSDYTLKKKSSSVDMAFDDKGNVKDITLLPPRAPDERPAIAPAALQNAFDPVTAFVMMSHFVNAAHDDAKENASFDMFDGKRLSRLTLTLKDKTHAILTRQALGGFREKELTEVKEEPDVNVYFTDGIPVPARVAIDIYSGTLAGVLKEHCVGVEACKAY